MTIKGQIRGRKMLNTIVVLLLVLGILWVLWDLWKNGWDLKKTGAGIIAAIAAVWMWLHDSLTSLTSGM